MKKMIIVTAVAAVIVLLFSCKNNSVVSTPTKSPGGEVYVERITDNEESGSSIPGGTGSDLPTPSAAPTAQVTPVITKMPYTTSTPTSTGTQTPKVTPTIKPQITPTPKRTMTPSKAPTSTPKVTETPTAKEKDYSAKVSIIDGVKVIEEISYERKNPVTSVVNIEDGKKIEVKPDETGYYYSLSESILSEEVVDYLKNQTSSNSLSRIHSPDRIIGRGYLEGTPFYYISLINSSISKRGDYDRVEIGNIEYSRGKILAACYSYPKKAAARVNGIDTSKLYLDAVYLDSTIESLGYSQSSCPKDMIVRQEKHLNIYVTRPMSEDYRSDYIFLAYPLLNGKYVINCGGGIIVLNECPKRFLDIRFSAGGGNAGFIDFQIFVDERKIFECDRFCINSYEGDCECYDPYQS